MFASFGSKVVDWKWEYMEDSFERLADGIDVFFSKLDVPKMQAPGGSQEGPQEVVIDGKCWVLLQATQQLNADKFSTLIELFNVFAGSVGHSARWHQGCPCHDHVWTRSDISEARKAQIMLEFSGGVSSTCWRKGRRASELARGHAKELADGVKRATSYRLQQRLARLDDQDRKELLHIFKVLKSSWCEEFLEKSHYHTILPHLAAGLWPVDSGTPDVAKRMLEQWKASDAKTCHRVTWRLMNPKSEYIRGIRKASEGGLPGVTLALEAKRMNVASTVEQYLEESHARVGNIQMHPGRKAEPPRVSAYLRWGQNQQILRGWVGRAYFKRAWQMHVLRHVLQPCEFEQRVYHTRFQ